MVTIVADDCMPWLLMGGGPGAYRDVIRPLRCQPKQRLHLYGREEISGTAATHTSLLHCSRGIIRKTE